MKRTIPFIVAFCVVLGVSSSWAMDVYDWRAKAQGLCAQTFKILDRPIQGAMAGGRPEKLVIEKIENLKDAVPTIQALGDVDDATARIIIKSLVHSYFTDRRLLSPLNLSIESYQQVYKNCSGSVLGYDPDGKKAAAYQKINDDKIDEARTAEEAYKQEAEEAARLENERKQNALEAAKAAEDARKRQKAEKNRLEEQRKQSELEEAQAQEAARIQKEEENQKQKVSYTDDAWAYMLALENDGYNKSKVHKVVMHWMSVRYMNKATKELVEEIIRTQGSDFK